MENNIIETINIGHFYERLYRQSGLPLQYMYDEPQLTPDAADRECFKCLARVQANCMRVFAKGNGVNLLIYSNNVGNGKTTWAQKIMRFFIMKHSVEHPDADYVFINVPEFLQLRKRAISNAAASKEFAILEERVREARLVVFDDIAYRQGSDFDEEYLYTIIDYRYRYMMNSIFTSNATQAEMRQVLGNRIADRILDTNHTMKYPIQGGSRRDTVSKPTQTFIPSASPEISSCRPKHTIPSDQPF